MQVLKLYMAIVLLALSSISVVANEPAESMASQCEQYGSYQDADGQWQSCEYEEQDDSEEDEPNYVEDELEGD